MMLQQLVQPANEQVRKKNCTAQKHFRVSEPDLPSNSFSGRLVAGRANLEQLVVPWLRLIDTAVRVNPFFDPDFLIPAVHHLGEDKVSVLVIEAPTRVNKESAPVICALFPVIRNRVYGIPLSCLQIWKHDFCFDCTPLVRRDCAAEVLAFVFEFIGDTLNTSLFNMNTIIGEGELANLFSDNFYRNSRSVFHRDEFTRACFKPLDDATTYINTKVSKSTRKGTQRLRRKLSESGSVETRIFDTYTPDLVDEFLKLESAGWKGNRGTAFASNEASNKFFREVAKRMLDSDKMIFSRTSLGANPIAILCDLQYKSTGSHFKTAFDENLKDYSPGVIAEFDNIERLHQSNIQFMDSCADPDHPMINRVWHDRVRFQSLVVALKGRVSKFAVSAMPMIQQFKSFPIIKRNAK